MSDIPENLPPRMVDLIRREQRDAKISAEVAAIADDGRDKIETEIMCDLWRDLGDHTTTYWEAMTAVSAFVAIEKDIFQKLDPLSHPVRVRIMEAVSRTLAQKAGIQRNIADKLREMKAADPLPGDH